MACRTCGNKRPNKKNLFNKKKMVVDPRTKERYTSNVKGSVKRKPKITSASRPPMNLAAKEGEVRYIAPEGRNLNIMEIAKKKKSIFLLMSSSGCSVCQYFLTLLKQVSTEELRMGVNFYVIERQNLNMRVLNPVLNPTLIVMMDGRIIMKEYGVVSNLKEIATALNNGGVLPRAVKPFK